MSSGFACFSSFPVLGLQKHSHVARFFYMGARASNLGSHVCMGSTIVTKLYTHLPNCRKHSNLKEYNLQCQKCYLLNGYIYLPENVNHASLNVVTFLSTFLVFLFRKSISPSINTQCNLLAKKKMRSASLWVCF